MERTYITTADQEAALAWMAEQQGLESAAQLFQQTCDNALNNFVVPFKAQQRASIIEQAEAALAAGKGFEVHLDPDTQQPIGQVKES
jgi:hypothetical protein